MGKKSRDISEKTRRIHESSRENDGFFSTFFLRKISRFITYLLVETRITPNAITLFSIVLGFSAAYSAASKFYLLGGFLLLLSLIFDCVDGEVARYKEMFSPLGAWLDALSDRVKEFVYIFALLWSVNKVQCWNIGITIVILQTTRHLSDYNFARLQKNFEDQLPKPRRLGFIYWMKKAIHLPIGERWLMLAVLPIFLSIFSSLRIILIFGVLSFMYAWLTRLRRMHSWKQAESDAKFISKQSDTLLSIKIMGRKSAWTIPSVLRLMEFLAFVALLNISPLLKYLLLMTIAFWHYANLYDSLQNREPVFGKAGLRMAGRISLCFIAVVTGFASEMAIFLTIYLAALLLLRGGHNVAKGTK